MVDELEKQRQQQYQVFPEKFCSSSSKSFYFGDFVYTAVFCTDIPRESARERRRNSYRDNKCKARLEGGVKAYYTTV